MCFRRTVKKNILGISPQKCLMVTLPCCAFIVYCACFAQRSLTGASSEISDETSPDLKYMLLWTRNDYSPFYYFRAGQEAFIKNNCSYTNCFVTTNRYQNLATFDAIAFNGRNMAANDLPKVRYPPQKYIYFNKESAPNQKVCNPVFDNFFNWTATYRLNSDIVYPYFWIKDWTGAIIGPKPYIEWKSEMKGIDTYLAKKLKSKKRAVAWFASNCNTGNHRTEIVKALQLELKHFGLPLDIYGSCGNLKCERNNEECNKMVSKDYYFYLSFENSYDEDYVTEKVLSALQHDAVPIVLGGANYSRFLPPGSYLQAYPDSLRALAKKIAILISKPDRYIEYFKWRSYYYYIETFSDIVCSVCAALNNKSLMSSVTVYKDFRRFLPPGSYLQAYPDSLRALAKKIAILISKPDRYIEYFKWRSYYYYIETFSDIVCSVCAALNNKSLMSSVTVYKDFRRWWYPNFKNHC